MCAQTPPFNRKADLANKRPDHVKPPSYLSKSPPVPDPGPGSDEEEDGGRNGPDPTRYGDWEGKGICRDF
ncbi:MAG TPA: DUF1674 domain-containing protein [Allosphingosinicella sp.]|nr:DUF1674 domain-containing protein [Allosphingosinicella sp.]